MGLQLTIAYYYMMKMEGGVTMAWLQKGFGLRSDVDLSHFPSLIIIPHNVCLLYSIYHIYDPYCLDVLAAIHKTLHAALPRALCNQLWHKAICSVLYSVPFPNIVGYNYGLTLYGGCNEGLHTHTGCLIS